MTPWHFSLSCTWAEHVPTTRERPQTAAVVAERVCMLHTGVCSKLLYRRSIARGSTGVRLHFLFTYLCEGGLTAHSFGRRELRPREVTALVKITQLAVTELRCEPGCACLQRQVSLHHTLESGPLMNVYITHSLYLPTLHPKD